MFIPSPASSSPYNTGGGGENFESRVGAAFTVLMMAKGVVPCVEGHQIQEIHFQSKGGQYTDDLVIHTADSCSSGKRKMLISVKSRVSAADSDNEFNNVITGAWLDFRNPAKFQRGPDGLSGDALVLVTRTLSGIDLDHTRRLFEWARSRPTSDAFLTQVKQNKSTSNEMRKKCTVFRSALDRANEGQPITDHEFYDFLRHFHWLSFDFDLRNGLDQALLISLCARTADKNPADVWRHILDHVQYLKQNAGIIRGDNMPPEIRRHFSASAESANPHVDPTDFPPMVDDELTKAPYALPLGQAMLLGSWRENCQMDKTTVEQFTGKPYSEWTQLLRDVAVRPGSPIRFRNDRWTMSDDMRRSGHWSGAVTEDVVRAFCLMTRRAFGYVCDDSTSGAVKAEDHPLVAWWDISDDLRKGICSGLALLSNRDWRFVADDRVRPYIRGAVHVILPGDDARGWAGLDDWLPLLSEAAPEVFLERADAALSAPGEPMRELFAGKSSVFAGCPWSGLLWALEGLAWHPDYFMRVVSVLGGLAGVDACVGNLVNRPKNSLATILLPWLPKTLASAESRYKAVSLLIENCKDVAWTLLLALLPKPGQNTSAMTARPKWLRLDLPQELPPVTKGEYVGQIERYADMAVSMAEQSPVLAADLIGSGYPYLPEAARARIKTLLTSDAIKIEPIRSKVWRTLNHYIDLRTGSDASPEKKNAWDLSTLEKIAEALTPEDVFLKHQPLFSHNEHIALMRKGVSYDEARANISAFQEEAICEILEQYGVQRVYEFANEVDLPHTAGWFLGAVGGPENDKSVLSHLPEYTAEKTALFVQGYIQFRHSREGWDWMDKAVADDLTPDCKAFFLSCVRLSKDSMLRAEQWLKNEEPLYWRRINTWLHDDENILSTAVERMLALRCASKAVDTLYGMTVHTGVVFRPAIDLCVRALLDSAQNGDKSSHGMDLFEEITKSPMLTSTQREQLEWAYIDDLYWSSRYGPVPAALWTKLANVPEFFRDAMIASYLRDDYDDSESGARETTRAEHDARFSHLLMNWNVPPGTAPDGSWIADHFSIWLEESLRLCGECGRQEIAKNIIGKVLVHCLPESPDLWLPKVVGDTLDRDDMDKMRRGYFFGQVNSLGSHWVDENGEIYTDKARNYREQAQQAENQGWTRLAATQRSVEEYFRNRAERTKEDEAP